MLQEHQICKYSSPACHQNGQGWCHSVSQRGQSCPCLFETCGVPSSRAGSNLCFLQGAQNSTGSLWQKTVLLCVYVCAEDYIYTYLLKQEQHLPHPSLNYLAIPMSCIYIGHLIKSSRSLAGVNSLSWSSANSKTIFTILPRNPLAEPSSKTADYS